MIVIVFVFVIVMMFIVMMLIMRMLAVMGLMLMMVVLVTVVAMMLGVGVMFGLESMGVILGGRFVLRGLCIRVLDDLAPDALAAPATAVIAMARSPATAVAFALFLSLAMGTLVGFDQGLTVGDRDLIIVGMNFAEGEEAVAIAAIFDEGCLQGWFYPRDLGEVDVAAQLLALGRLEVKFFDAIAADHDDPGLFRVGGIDQHFVRHFGTLGGGGSVCP